MLRHGLQLTNRGENWHNAARMYSLVWRNEMLTSIFKIGVFWCNQTAGSWFRHSKLLLKGAVRYRYKLHLITMCRVVRQSSTINDWIITTNKLRYIWKDVVNYVEFSQNKETHGLYHVVYRRFTQQLQPNYNLRRPTIRISFINKKKIIVLRWRTMSVSVSNQLATLHETQYAVT